MFFPPSFSELYLIVEAKERDAQFPVLLQKICPFMAGRELHSAAGRKSMLQSALGEGHE